ncbi:MAG: pseudouridine synthase [bacterium]
MAARPTPSASARASISGPGREPAVLPDRPVRLQKFLADRGVAARRRCEDHIRAGRVTVNGEVARVGDSVNPESDRVELDGRPIQGRTPRTVLVLNKPRGYLCACRRGREVGRLVTELVPVTTRLFPVGRLDRDSEGLLLLTDDGELANRLGHPGFGKEKEYEVELDRRPAPGVASRLVAGVELEDGPARAVRARDLGDRVMSVVLTQGRKRQVRRMYRALGYRVTRLVRVRVAGLGLGNLRPGEWRRLDADEVRSRLVDAGRPGTGRRS